jgi:hypothetical protein
MQDHARVNLTKFIGKITNFQNEDDQRKAHKNYIDDIINKGLHRVQQVTKGFFLHQFYYNQVTVTDTRNLLEYYL